MSEERPKRTGLKKGLRFEIFKRDGFRCIYCGATAVQSPLRVDHVVPVAAGGTNDPANLATACLDCNAGKAARRLEDRRLGPSPIATEAMEDHAEQIREYLALQRGIEEAKNEAADVLTEYWEQRVGGISQKLYDRLPKIMAEFPYEKLIEAINITAKNFGSPGKAYEPARAIRQQRYFQAILRNWREGRYF